MPPDNHLFGDLPDGAAENVTLTYHIKDGDVPDAPLKYSFSTPRQVYSSLQRTIQAGCPSKNRLAEDINRVFCETLRRIIDAKGTYIEDYSTKSVRHGTVCEKRQHQAVKKRETLPVDNAMIHDGSFQWNGPEKEGRMVVASPLLLILKRMERHWPRLWREEITKGDNEDEGEV
jgi:hypothetical protein